MNYLIHPIRFLALCLCLTALPSQAQWITRAGLQNVVVWAVLGGDTLSVRRLFASQYANGQVSILSTDDEGLTWQSRSIGGDPHPALYWIGTVPRPDGSPSGGGDLYASVRVSADVFSGNRCTLLRSSDRGATWAVLASGIPACSFAIDPSDPRVMYGMGDGYPAQFYPWLYKSTDGGTNWYSTSNNIEHSIRGIRVAADGRVYALGGANSVSRDKGATWTKLSNWPHFGTSSNGVVQAYDLLPIRHPVYGYDYALIATNSGLYQTTDGGLTFQPVGLQGFEVSGLNVARTTASGDLDVFFSYAGGIGLFRLGGGGGSLVALQNGLEPGTTAYGISGGRYAFGPSGLFICPDLDTCIGGSLPHLVEMVEFHNTVLDHYFITADTSEAAAIDARAAGPGWTRTGLSFPVYPDKTGTSYMAQAVCRFYGTLGRGPNSHFFTADPGECDRVKSDVGWTLESANNFIAYVPAFTYFPDTKTNAYDCGIRQNVLRLYNNRFAQNDSNHRYTTDVAVYATMQAKGWVGEGTRLCAARPIQ